MTTSFWQIRNRDFLTHPVSHKGTASIVRGDLTRDMSHIHINGIKLESVLFDRLSRKKRISSIYHQESNANDGDLLSTTYSLFKQQTTEQDLISIFKEKLLNFCKDEQQKNKYALSLCKVLYQWGLIYACSQSLVNNNEVAEKHNVYVNADGINKTVNIYLKNNKIYIEEKVELMFLTQATDEFKHIQNADGSPLATFKNKFVIKEIEVNNKKRLGYKHTDLTINYNNELVKSFYDKRTLLDKIKDFFKSIFNMNDIDDFTLDKPSPLALKS